MNKEAIYHRPDSEYCYPLDGSTLRIVLRTARGERLKEVGLLWNNKYDFCERRQFARLKKMWSAPLYDYYIADLKSDDVRFAYIFLLTLSDGREYYFSEDGVTEEYDFKHGYYTFFQYPFINGADVAAPVPWAEEAIVYQIFPDRFRRGDMQKDDSYITQAWGELPKPKCYTGGDLKGILEKLGEIADMGFNTLYLTPVFRSPSNHKYNIADYLSVDPMFGTNDDLKALIAAAHARGMRIVMDAVFNHCDESNAMFADVKARGRESAYCDWFIIRGDFPARTPSLAPSSGVPVLAPSSGASVLAPSSGGGQGGGSHTLCNYEIFADCPYMPKWNTSSPKVREYLLNVALAYLSWGIDGLRLDVADEVSHTFWRELRRAVKEKYPEALLIGEVWHENRMYLRGDEFDGVMNYKLQKVFLDFFAYGRIGAGEAAARIDRITASNMRQSNIMMLNFLDNHDTPRFLRACGEDKEKLKTALSALYFCTGMPCVFYGTELPLTGDGDPDCRRTYDWSKDPEFKGYLTALSRMRRELPRGELRAREEDGALVLVRESETERVTAYFGGKKKGKIVREQI